MTHCEGIRYAKGVMICHIRSPVMNLTGCEIRFVLSGPDGRVTEWSLTKGLAAKPREERGEKDKEGPGNAPRRGDCYDAEWV